MEEWKETCKTERRRKDTNDRKTIKTVLDKKTLEIINKLKKQEMILEMHGAVSMGKEACVYLATASPSIWSKLCKKPLLACEKEISVAVKIYKTSAMVFKDRERYLVGERRFRSYPRGNSRKLVKIWAEKEVRNLNRLQKAGIPSPKPLFLRRNILIMTMIGNCTGLKSMSTTPDSASPSRIPIDDMEYESFDTTEYDLDSHGNVCVPSTSTSNTESISYTGSEEGSTFSLSDEESSGNPLENISITSSSESQETAQGVLHACADFEQQSADMLPVCVLDASENENGASSESSSACEESACSSTESAEREDESSESSDEAEGGQTRSYEVPLCAGLGGVAPNLKDANLVGVDLQNAYNQVVELIQKMYDECGLVHADLSEYNMLYWNGLVHIIDVSQSVEHDHPNAREFLQMDISNVNRYFSRLGAVVHTDEELFKEVYGDGSVLREASAEEAAQGVAEGVRGMHLQKKSVFTEEEKKAAKDKRKLQKKQVKEERKKQRETKISKKEKKRLSRKVRILREKKNK
ncbi:RIO kinase 1 [Nematocida major]|uniref:RIO kinase 1 n=1 Tax=Nematocida major TaxID=1912982 RepID=UPI00200871AD|nr:RIO kinase 1 [Nematocida major]KAH9385410.1 RIO kinase 1 [Nematocida major]